MSYVVGVGHHLPQHVVTNAAFDGKTLKKINTQGKVEKEVTCSDAWIIQRSGIHERRYASEHETPHLMGALAVRMALVQSSVPMTDLDGIVVGTVTSERVFPSTACEIQHLLGISPQGREFWAYDLNAACAGYLVAMSNADALLRAHSLRALATVGVEHLTKIVDMEDANAFLFGDGAGASIVVSSSYLAEHFRGRLAGAVRATYATSDTDGDNLLAIHRDQEIKLRMGEGDQVFKFATQSMASAVRRIKEKTGWTNDALDLVIPHQANLRILKAVAHANDLPMEKIYVNIERYGNMSSATCAVAHSEALREGSIREGSKVILTAFGSGYVTSAVGLEYCLVSSFSGKAL